MVTAEQVVRYHQYQLTPGTPAAFQPVDAQVITEADISLSVNGEDWLSFACTPTDLEALAVGFLYNEGFIRARSEVAVVDVRHAGSSIDVWLHHTVERPTHWKRTTGCGGGQTASGGQTVGDKTEGSAPVSVSEAIEAQIVLNGIELLGQAQELYRQTGGVHCSTLSDGYTLYARAEDIGRHNTLDKLAGKLLLESITFTPRMIFTTGRISSEMLEKSARMEAVLVASRTSPTSQSVMLARRLGITLVGYARKSGFIVYAHPERLAGGAEITM